MLSPEQTNLILASALVRAQDQGPKITDWLSAISAAVAAIATIYFYRKLAKNEQLRAEREIEALERESRRDRKADLRERAAHRKEQIAKHKQLIQFAVYDADSAFITIYGNLSLLLKAAVRLRKKYPAAITEIVSAYDELAASHAENAIPTGSLLLELNNSDPDGNWPTPTEWKDREIPPVQV